MQTAGKLFLTKILVKAAALAVDFTKIMI